MTYRIELRNATGWRQRTTAVLGVSVSSPNWQDDKFAAILGFAARHFSAVKIDVTDALNRHGVPGATPAQALAQANAMGALWLTRHQDIIAASPVATEVKRWAQWYDHPDYQATLAGMERAHATNPQLRAAVAADVNSYYARHNAAPTLREQEAGRAFVLEEMAVLTLQARTWQGLRLYPGSQMQSLALLRAGAVPEAPKGLEQEQFARVQLRPVKQPAYRRQIP